MRLMPTLCVLTWFLPLGCGGGGGSPTRQSQCAEVVNVLCAREANPCQLFPSDQVAPCVSSGVTSCCGQTCSATPVSTEQEIQTCVDDVQAASCPSLNVFDGGALPAACIGVVK